MGKTENREVMHEKIHLFFLEVDLRKEESKLSKMCTPSQAYCLQCTCEWINDAALESSTLVVEPCQRLSIGL